MGAHCRYVMDHPGGWQIIDDNLRRRSGRTRPFSQQHCVPPEIPMRDIVDQCRVWESYADSDVWRASKPGPYPTYMVSGSDRGMDYLQVAAVNTPQSTPDQLETLLRRFLAGAATPAPAPKPESSVVEKLLRLLLLTPLPWVMLGYCSRPTLLEWSP